jgi:tetratricopeptide (TPR) repeat protein
VSAARASLALGAAALLAACAGAGAEAGTGAGDVREAAVEARGPGPETISLLGQPLYAPPVPEADRASLGARLAETHAAHLARPDDVEALIVYARVLGQAGRFREAVAVFSDGLRMHPDDAHLYRFRGHRFITLRQFDLAVEDLTRASQLVFWQPDEVEPGLKPNARGIDLDTLQENIWYHLALAHYLRGEWEPALAAWRRCAALAPNDDGRAMAAYWSANAAARMGRPDEVAAAVAGITADMDIVEYHAYHQLALLWKGERDGDALLAEARAGEGGAASIDFATLGYGDATWPRARGEDEAARAVLDDVLRSPNWHAFGYIAAEADVAREAGG